MSIYQHRLETCLMIEGRIRLADGFARLVDCLLTEVARLI